MTILKELWTSNIEDEEVKTTYQYVVDLRQRLEDTCKLAQEELVKNSKKYKTYYDTKAKVRSLKKGDVVLLLLPSDNNKLLMQWKGPFTVIEKVNPFDYKVNIKGKIKTYHGNMLQQYHRRPKNVDDVQESETQMLSCVSVIEESEMEIVQEECKETDNKWVSVEFPAYTSKESVSDVQVCNDLSPEKKAEIQELLNEFSDVFSDVPGTSNIVEHEIKLTSSQPVRSKQYPVPYSLKKGHQRRNREYDKTRHNRALQLTICLSSSDGKENRWNL